MFNKKNNHDILLDEPQDQEKKSAKKILIDIIGIIVVILVIIGTYLVIVFREEIIAAIPIIRDENGKIIIKKEEKKKTTREQEELTVPPSISYMYDCQFGAFEASNINVDDKGLSFDLSFTPKSNKTLTPVITVERASIDGYEFPISLEYKFNGEKSLTQEVLIDKTDLDEYSIIRPNTMKLFVLDSEVDTKGIPKTATLKFDYPAPMDNSLRGLIQVDSMANLSIYFYKQESDVEYTYLYFDMRNTSSSEKQKIRVKKLVVNDTIIESDDIEEESYFLSEKLFYIRIPRQRIARVNNFAISFFIILNEDQKNEQIHITKEFTHAE